MTKAERTSTAPGRTRDPVTPSEWQQAVDCSHVLLLLDSARQYGLVTGGPKVNVDRCLEILERGKRHDYVPKEPGITVAIKTLIGAPDAKGEGEPNP